MTTAQGDNLSESLAPWVPPTVLHPAAMRVPERVRAQQCTPATMEHLIPAPAALVERPQRSQAAAVCLPGPGAHEVVPPCFATHVAGSGLSWLSRTLKNDDPPNPNKPDIDLYPGLERLSARLPSHRSGITTAHAPGAGGPVPVLTSSLALL